MKPNRAQVIRDAIQHRDRCLLALGGQADIVSWNWPTGRFLALSGATVTVGQKGQADIGGFIVMGGLPLAFACECKHNGGRLDAVQKMWRDAWLMRGGIYILGRDPAMVVSDLRNAAVDKFQTFDLTGGVSI